MNMMIYAFMAIFGSFIVTMKTPLFFMIGSWATFFSAVSIISPLAGYFGGAVGSSLYIMVRLFWRFLFNGSLCSMSLFIHTVPGWCSTMFWLVPRVVTSVLVPLCSIVLFVMHPVGSQAYVYALLWIIPIALFFSSRINISGANSFFAQALCATFVAHAVGSVLWLYGMPPLKPEVWILLTPIALGERLFFAFGMTAIRVVVINGVRLSKESFANTKAAIVRIAR